jgi:negative regulator of sigma-B (phosphoserine phosphatase)
MEMAMNVATLEWGVASLPLPGESESGDRCVVAPFDAGVLVAVIDALGHGPDAAHAAAVAAGVLEADAREKPGVLFNRCHELMRSTRGAAISAASIDSRGTMTWLGVGNVMGVIVRADGGVNPRIKQMVVHGGVVGYQLRDMQPLVMQVGPGDVLILATDGVHRDFTDILPAALKPQLLADRILREYATRIDDALVLVFHCGDSEDR